jgi:hypothetical protein
VVTNVLPFAALIKVQEHIHASNLCKKAQMNNLSASKHKPRIHGVNRTLQKRLFCNAFKPMRRSRAPCWISATLEYALPDMDHKCRV